MARCNLQNKVVWVTGAGSGIGAALVRPLVDRGAKVAISGRREEMLRAVAAGADAKPLVVPADVSRREDVRAAVQKILETLGPIDVAIFNAGVNRPHSAKNFNAEAVEQIFQTNVLGVVYGVEAVLAPMLARRSGCLVAVASVAGYRALPIAPAYGASKAALAHLFDSLRFSLEPRGVQVTVVNPGFVDTPMTAGMKQPMPFRVTADEAARRILAGLEAGKREIHFPRRLTWIAKALRIIPYGVYHALTSRAVRS
jgi:NAD(P)-dependent dehydrogenase (short-subunit alcohol dehydrogenase family)